MFLSFETSAPPVAPEIKLIIVVIVVINFMNFRNLSALELGHLKR